MGSQGFKQWLVTQPEPRFWYKQCLHQPKLGQVSVKNKEFNFGSPMWMTEMKHFKLLPRMLFNMETQAKFPTMQCRCPTWRLSCCIKCLSLQKPFGNWNSSWTFPLTWALSSVTSSNASTERFSNVYFHLSQRAKYVCEDSSKTSWKVYPSGRIMQRLQYLFIPK